MDRELTEVLDLGVGIVTRTIWMGDGALQRNSLGHGTTRGAVKRLRGILGSRRFGRHLFSQKREWNG